MIFGLLNSTARLVEDAIDVGVGVLTLGEAGDVSKEKVSRLIAAGLTAYAISEMTGIAVDVIEKMAE